MHTLFGRPVDSCAAPYTLQELPGNDSEDFITRDGHCTVNLFQGIIEGKFTEVKVKSFTSPISFSRIPGGNEAFHIPII